MHRRLARIFRILLIGSGAVTLVMSGVNVVATYQLIQPGDEQYLGLSRSDFLWWYGFSAVIGLAAVVGGLCWRPRP